jgi:hypothetical protein
MDSPLSKAIQFIQLATEADTKKEFHTSFAHYLTSLSHFANAIQDALNHPEQAYDRPFFSSFLSF